MLREEVYKVALGLLAGAILSGGSLFYSHGERIASLEAKIEQRIKSNRPVSSPSVTGESNLIESASVDIKAFDGSKTKQYIKFNNKFSVAPSVVLSIKGFKIKPDDYNGNSVLLSVDSKNISENGFNLVIEILEQELYREYVEWLRIEYLAYGIRKKSNNAVK